MSEETQMKLIKVLYGADRNQAEMKVPFVRRAKGLAVTPKLTAERVDAFIKDGTVLPLPTRKAGEPPLQWAVTHETSGWALRYYDSKSAAVNVFLRLVATGVNWTLPADEIMRRKSKFLKYLSSEKEANYGL